MGLHEKKECVIMLKYILCVMYVICSVAGLTLIKLGSNDIVGNSLWLPVLNLRISMKSIAGIMCYGISFCLYLGVVSKFDLGFIIPILGGIVNISILVVSCYVLKEKLSINMIIGAVFIIIGIMIMTFKRN